MNETEIAEIFQELGRKHPRTVGSCDLNDFERTLEMVPDSGEWKVADRAAAVFALVPGDTMFTISIAPPATLGAVCAVSMTSRALDGHRLVAHLEWGGQVRTRGSEVWRRTEWTFHYRDQHADDIEEWQTVSGMVRVSPLPAELDRDEEYARSLLRRVGQRVA
jgi:hypothetical protein